MAVAAVVAVTLAAVVVVVAVVRGGGKEVMVPALFIGGRHSPVAVGASHGGGGDGAPARPGRWPHATQRWPPSMPGAGRRFCPPPSPLPPRPTQSSFLLMGGVVRRAVTGGRWGFQKQYLHEANE